MPVEQPVMATVFPSCDATFDEEAILSQLPEHMQHEMYHIMYHKITEHIPFFANLDEESKAAGEPARAKQRGMRRPD